LGLIINITFKMTSSSSVYILTYSQSLWNFPNFCLWGGINYMKKCLSKSSGNGIGAFSTIGSESSRVFLKVLLLINTFSFILEWVSTLFLTWILLEYFPWMFLHLQVLSEIPDNEHLTVNIDIWMYGEFFAAS